MLEAVGSNLNDRMMMGMQGMRSNAWMNEGVDDLKPKKQLSLTNENKPQNLRPKRKKLVANNFITDSVDFDKIIVEEAP